MSVTALIKFTQGPNTDVAGHAVKGTLADGVVTVTNGDNTDVARWRVELLYNPPGSALGAIPGTPVILDDLVSPLPSSNFLPDAPDGCYRIRLTVWDSSGAYDVDIRNFAIPTGRGVVIPPYQKLPDPLPVLGTGEAGEKPDELNFDGQLYGWLGGAAAGLHGDFFQKYDDLPPETVITTPYSAIAETTPPLYVVDLAAIGSDAVLNLPTSGLRAGQRFRVAAYGDFTKLLSVVPPPGHTINTLSSLALKAPNCVVIVYLGGTAWMTVGSKFDTYERSIVAGEESVDVTGFQTIGASALLDPADFPNTSATRWSAVIETTSVADAAEVRLFNVTLGTPVAGSTLSTTSITPAVVSSTITLDTGPNLYEAQMRLATTGAPNVATCRQAQVAIDWYQP
jgi:hypothetical protein